MERELEELNGFSIFLKELKRKKYMKRIKSQQHNKRDNITAIYT
jgi:hypothetical protein